MRGFDDVLERALITLVTRMPGKPLAALVLVLYPGLALIVPWALGWSVTNLIAANVLEPRSRS